MKCDDLERYLHPFLDNELTAAECLDIQRHLEGCPACRRLVEVQAGIMAFIREATAHEEAPEALWGKITRRIQAEDQRIKLWQRAGFDLVAPVVFGIAAAALSFFLLREYMAAGALSPLTHAVLGVISGGLFGGLVRLGLRGPGRVIEERLNGRLRVSLRPLAWVSLGAALLTCLLFFLFPLPAVTGLAWRVLAPTVPAGPPTSFGEYLLLGGGYALMALFAGGLLVGRWVRGNVISNGLVAACLYVVVMAPGFAVVCIPLTATALLGMALGSAAGGVVGGTVGIWALATR